MPSNVRRILHLDVDAFLASVEAAVHPELAGKPLVIGGSPRSRNLVMSCSYEARSFGIRPGMHLSEAARRCPAAIFRDGDSQAANRKRTEVVRILLGFTPAVEVTSIDDFFADLAGTERLLGTAFDAAERIRVAIRERTRLPVTIGIGTNRLLARLAGKLAKPGGVAEILPGRERAFLASMPVGELPGVGHSIGPKLERFAIRTVGELALVPREVLFASFGRDGLVLYERARGRDVQPIEATHVERADGELVVRAPRSIRRETTFEPEEGRRELVQAMLAYLIERGAHRLRALGLACGAVETRILYVDTRPRVDVNPVDSNETGPGHAAFAKRRAFRSPTDSTHEIGLAARRLLAELPRRRALVKRIGVTLVDISPAAGWQGRLFDEAEGREHRLGSRADRHRRLDAAIDHLRERLGFGRILRGSSAPLVATHPLRPDGFQLRTPSLNQ
ncbi:MAG: DNA polymerase IV [Planctomycetota bacterium]|nr:DNA polymerase IV [Planctomycetota bacterium]